MAEMTFYCRRNLVTDTTAAFRHELLHIALPFPGDWIHDEWLAVCVAASDEGKPVRVNAAVSRFERPLVFGNLPCSQMAGTSCEYRIRGHHRFADEFAGMVLNGF